MDNDYPSKYCNDRPMFGGHKLVDDTSLYYVHNDSHLCMFHLVALAHLYSHRFYNWLIDRMNDVIHVDFPIIWPVHYNVQAILNAVLMDVVHEHHEQHCGWMWPHNFVNKLDLMNKVHYMRLALIELLMEPNDVDYYTKLLDYVKLIMMMNCILNHIHVEAVCLHSNFLL